MSKKNLLVYGAGAIGRGYVPWVFPPDTFTLTFVEASPTLRERLNTTKTFTTYCTQNNAYTRKTVPVQHCYAPGEEEAHLQQFDGIVTAVGPRQVLSLKEALAKAKCPIVLFENDASLAETLRTLTGNPNIYFGIPDVITSNTAPQDLLGEDPLSIVTEDGVCFIDQRAESLGGNVSYVPQNELEKQWLAKLYIHNTPHCIAAYLGALCHKTYLHEGMQFPDIYAIVEGAMLEMQDMLLKRYALDPNFVAWYGAKELKRFSNILLYDPIERVAREPFRKLAPDNRLIGAAQLALSTGTVPKFCITGIIAAFLYNKQNDPDFNISFLMKALSPEQFLKLIIQLNPHEALFKLMVDAWPTTLARLKEIARVHQTA